MAREALHGWKLRHSVQQRELAALKVYIGTGLADIWAGRVRDFDAA